MIINAFKKFLAMEAAGGAVLMVVAVLAMVAANSPFLPYYETILTPNVQFFINDGLMAIFFLLVGLEIRAQIAPGGMLSTRAQAILPLVAALGGVMVPALIYVYFNAGSDYLRGWAIPSATDIAFSLGILALFGSRLPISLKIFLMAVAVIDDLAAVIIIAIFYTAELSLPNLAAASACVAALWFLGKKDCQKLWLYLLIGAALWHFVHASGIHATIAGVALGLLIPTSLSEKLIHRLHPWVAFGIVPIFAFANAGVVLASVDSAALTHPITLGIALGLFIGKPLGICAASFALIRAGLAKLPEHARAIDIFTISVVAGIGFTMSLFIGGLAFNDAAMLEYTKLGVLLGSGASILLGAALLYFTSRKRML